MQPEPCLSITANQLHLNRGHVDFAGPQIAGLSMHSIGRWFARRPGNATAEALHRDLLVLAEAVPRVIAEALEEKTADFAVETEGGGAWVGVASEDVNTKWQLLNVRTFFWRFFDENKTGAPNDRANNPVRQDGTSGNKPDADTGSSVRAARH